jgi:hypothetical protein
MLTARENFLELLNGGKAERFVNQYEPFEFFIGDPLRTMDRKIPGQDTKDTWVLRSAGRRAITPVSRISRMRTKYVLILPNGAIM